MVRGLTAVCRCPKGMLLSKDRITCSVPMESTFILLLSRTTVYQVNFLTLVWTCQEFACSLIVNYIFLPRCFSLSALFVSLTLGRTTYRFT